MTFAEATAQATVIKRILRTTRAKRTVVRKAMGSIMRVTPREYHTLVGEVKAYTAVIEYLKPMLEDLNETASYVLKLEQSMEEEE